MAESQYSRELGEGIMDAPTPDESGVRLPARSAAVKRVIDAREPDEFAELVEQARPIEFEPEVLPEEETGPDHLPANFTTPSLPAEPCNTQP